MTVENIVYLKSHGGPDAAFNAGGHQVVASIIRSEYAHCAEVDEEAYDWVIARTPTTGAARIFGYLKNLADEPLVITGMDIVAPTAEQVQFYVGGGTAPVGGTDATPVNAVCGSTNTCPATRAVIQDSNAITGTTGGSVVRTVDLPAAVPQVIDWTNNPITVKKNGVLYLKSVNSNILITASIHFFVRLFGFKDGE